MTDAQKLQQTLETNPQFSAWFEEYLNGSVFKKTHPQNMKDFFGRNYLAAFSSFDKIYAKYENETEQAKLAVHLHSVWINHRMRSAGDTEKSELINSTEAIQDFNKIFM
jgi:hypothetical protein